MAIWTSLAAAADWHTTLFEIVAGRPAGLGERIVQGLVVIAAVFVPGVLLFAMFAIWWERRVAGRMQSRMGPNRVGPQGLLQSLADGIKLILKEDLTPRDADRMLFQLAPYLVFAPVFAAFMVLPFGPYLTFEPGLNAGVFWILAVLDVEVMGVILAGWASNNKWAVYGGMREACQMVSYAIPLGLSIIVGVMAAGTMNLVDLGFQQGGGLHTWIVFRNPFVSCAFFVYFVASLASNKRAPFDLPESESELVAGYHTEYSGMRFAFFFFAEYAAMFVVGGIQVALFLGGWNDPFGVMGYYYSRFAPDPAAHARGLVVLNVLACGMFVLKVLTVVFVQMWLRWTLPRPRIDQVLYACVKVLLPAACLLLLGGALWELLVPSWYTTKLTENPLPWRDYQPFRWAEWARGGATAALVAQVALAAVGVGLFVAVVGWVFYAYATGRRLRQRLTHPDPIAV
jgi:NADH-quinone oxidoreductase subunit H